MNTPATKAQRTLLSKAFATLRRRGYIARQNFLCCSGCAGNELGNMLSRLKGLGGQWIDPTGLKYLFAERRRRAALEAAEGGKA